MRSYRLLILAITGVLLVGLAPPAPPDVAPAEPVYSPSLLPTPTAPAPGPGADPLQAGVTKWFGEYFNNRSLDGDPVGTRFDECIDFNWGTSSPWRGVVNADDFSVRWTKEQYFEPGPYKFHVLVDDGARFWIDTTLMIDEWRTQSPHEYTNTIDLEGGLSTLQLEYFDASHVARIELWWESLKEINNGWRAEYYNYIDTPNFCNGPVLVQRETAIDHDWGSGSPSSRALGGDRWAARWTGDPYFVGGLTRFFTLNDDGAVLWVDTDTDGDFEDEEIVIDQWEDQPAEHPWMGDVYLAPGTHRVKLEYYERTGNAVMRLWWRPW
jgi:hypothetical protein